jgi:hypothetical protein
MALPPTRGGSTTHSRQTTAHATSPATAAGPDPNRVLEIYRECVANGMWARVFMENKRGGELFSLSFRRPTAATECSATAATPTAAGVGVKKQKRKKAPNERRRERYRQWRESLKNRICSSAATAATAWRVSPEVEAAATAATATATGEQIPAAAASTPLRPAVASSGTPAGPSERIATPAEACSADSNDVPVRSMYVSPIQTRAKKRRLASARSPPTIPQLDGAASPPASPSAPSTPRQLLALTYVPARPPVRSPPPQRERRAEIESMGAAHNGKTHAAVGGASPPPQ